MKKAGSKIYFNQKDILQNPELAQCSAEAKCFCAWLAAYASGCAKPGYLTEHGRPLTAADLAAIVGYSAQRAGELLKELIDRGVILWQQGVMMLKIVAHGHARSAKASKVARERYGRAQGDLFDRAHESGPARAQAKNNVRSMRCLRRGPPYLSPNRYLKKGAWNIFRNVDDAELPQDRTAAQTQNRGLPTPMQWVVWLDIVKLRACEVMDLQRRFGFDGEQMGKVIQSHDRWMKALPAWQRRDWRKLFIHYCTRQAGRIACGRQLYCLPRGSGYQRDELSTAQAAA
jgi:hypothetical protein